MFRNISAHTNSFFLNEMEENGNVGFYFIMCESLAQDLRPRGTHSVTIKGMKRNVFHRRNPSFKTESSLHYEQL